MLDGRIEGNSHHGGAIASMKSWTHWILGKTLSSRDQPENEGFLSPIETPPPQNIKD